MTNKKCPKCSEPLKGEYWCNACKTVIKCPLPGCEATIKPGASECHRCGLFFEDYLSNRKMYRRCLSVKEAGPF